MAESLSKYFSGIGAKRLSNVEINPSVSNQHEFNGINEFRNIFGDSRIEFRGTFILLNDNPDLIISEEGKLTWYNARENHETRTEYRLYYSTNNVIASAEVGDLIIIGRTSDSALAVIVAPRESTAEQQMRLLFGLKDIKTKFIIKNIISDDNELNFAGKYIISTLGIEIDETLPDYLDQLLKAFGNQFPKTQVFSAFARSTFKAGDLAPLEEPDNTLLSWIEREELLFRTLEKHIVQEKLTNGFGHDGLDVDEFISYSLSVQNRRKSRAGYAFENHLVEIFNTHKLLFSQGARTERNNKPDFLFPGISYYRLPEFSVDLLTMLGVKTTAKDRWRQVLAEAKRIEKKHLITLEPAISQNQTEEMIAQNLQLVIPEPLISTYEDDQQESLINLADFIKLISERQKKA